MSHEKRRKRRDIPPKQPRGKFSLYFNSKYLDVYLIRDISPFGVGVKINEQIKPGEIIRLNYNYEDINIDLLGTIAWNKTINDNNAEKYLTGIDLDTKDMKLNVSFFQLMLGQV